MHATMHSPEPDLLNASQVSLDHVVICGAISTGQPFSSPERVGASARQHAASAEHRPKLASHRAQSAALEAARSRTRAPGSKPRTHRKIDLWEQSEFWPFAGAMVFHVRRGRVLCAAHAVFVRRLPARPRADTHRTWEALFPDRARSCKR